MATQKVLNALTKQGGILFQALTEGFGMDLADRPLLPGARDYFHFHEDFIGYDATNSPDWGVDETSASGSEAGTVAAIDGIGGQVTVTAGSADNDGCTLYLKTEFAKCEADREGWFLFRAKVSHATEIDLFIGMIAYEADLQDVSDNMPADGFGFRKEDGDTNLDICSSKDGTNTASTAVGTLTTDFHEYLIHWDGVDTLTFYLDGTEVGTVATNVCDDELLTPVFMFRNGNAVARVLTADLCDVIQPRTAA
jgi:hypothetical protein